MCRKCEIARRGNDGRIKKLATDREAEDMLAELRESDGAIRKVNPRKW